MTTETIITNARWTSFCWAWEAIGKAIAVPYNVNLWASHPDEGNDDCYTGEDYATNEAACAAFMATVHDAPGSILYWDPALRAAGSPDPRVYFANWMYIVVDGPDVHLVAKNPRYSAKRARREAREADAEWRGERAHQAGMVFGCDGFNDEMGY